MEALAALKPVFEENGTLTAGNSSPVTDGAAAVLLMSEERAKIEGREPLAFIRAMEYGAIDPDEGLNIHPLEVHRTERCRFPPLLPRLDVGENLGGERFVDLDQIDGLELQ